MLRLSMKLGISSFRRWLAEMTSREYTEYRAMSIIDVAQHFIADPKSHAARFVEYEPDDHQRVG